MLKLYDYTAAPSPRRTRMFLAEKKVPYDCIQVNIQAGEQLSDEFKAINPRCTVPALVTRNGETICENVAIAHYIGELYPEPNMMGGSAIERARVLEWNWRCEFEGLSAVAEILRNTSKGMKGRAMTGPRNIEQLPELAARGKERLGYFFEDLNKQLETHSYVAGPNYSLADITATVTVDFSKWVKCYPDETLTALHEWHGRMKARPSYTA